MLFALASVMEAINAALMRFIAAWFVVYVLIGPALKLRLCGWKAGDFKDWLRAAAPLAVPHLAYSLIFVNLYSFDRFTDALRLAGSALGIGFAWLLGIALYFGGIPVAVDGALARLAPRFEMLRSPVWFALPSRRILAGLAASALAFAAGAAAFYVRF